MFRHRKPQEIERMCWKWRAKGIAGMNSINSNNNSNIELIIFDLDDTLFCLRNRELFYDARVTLQRLKNNGYKIGLVSYNAKARAVLQSCGIHGLFDYVLCENWKICGIDGKENMLRTIIQQSGVLPERTLFVDDQYRFLQTAQRLGMNVCTAGVGRVETQQLMKYVSFRI